MVLSPKGPNIYEKKNQYPLFSNISTAFLKLSILHYKKTANGIYHLYFIKISDIVSYTSIYKLLCLVFFSFFFFLLFWVLAAARGLSLVAVSRDFSLVVTSGLLIAVASFVMECGFQGSRAR